MANPFTVEPVLRRSIAWDERFQINATACNCYNNQLEYFKVYAMEIEENPYTAMSDLTWPHN